MNIFTVFPNKIKIVAPFISRKIKQSQLFGFCSARGKLIQGAREKKGYPEHAGGGGGGDLVCTRTDVMFVSASDRWQVDAAAAAATEHPTCSACMLGCIAWKANHWLRDHNTSHASHSVMEISHLIETFLCGSWILHTIWTLWCPLKFLQMAPELISGTVSIPRLPSERTVNHP